MTWLLFFVQAEDGIRDYKVTGVQTCALPISLRQRRTVTSTGRKSTNTSKWSIRLLPLVQKAQPAMARAVTQSICERDRKSTRLNSSHLVISYAVFCLKKKTKKNDAEPALGRE